LRVHPVRGKDFAIPAGIRRDLVVSKGKRTLLGIAQAGHHDDGNLFKPKLLGREIPANSRDDIAMFIDQNRTGPTKGDHTVGNLIDLLFGMGSRVSGRRFEVSKGFTSEPHVTDTDLSLVTRRLIL
jgi:hypothetical protein